MPTSVTAVDADGGDGEEVEDADIDIGADDVDGLATDIAEQVAEDVTDAEGSREGDLGDPVLADRGHLPHAAPRDDDEPDEGGGDDHDRREAEEDLVDLRGGVVLLQEELHAVGEGLAQTEEALEGAFPAQELQEGEAEVEADAVRADAVLDVRGDLAFEVDEVGDAEEHDMGHDRQHMEADEGLRVDPFGEKVDDRVHGLRY